MVDGYKIMSWSGKLRQDCAWAHSCTRQTHAMTNFGNTKVEARCVERVRQLQAYEKLRFGWGCGQHAAVGGNTLRPPSHRAPHSAPGPGLAHAQRAASARRRVSTLLLGVRPRFCSMHAPLSGQASTFRLLTAANKMSAKQMSCALSTCHQPRSAYLSTLCTPRPKTVHQPYRSVCIERTFHVRRSESTAPLLRLRPLTRVVSSSAPAVRECWVSPLTLCTRPASQDF